MKIRVILSLCLGLCIIACGEEAAAPGATVEAAVTLANGRTVAEQIEYRKGQYKKLGGAFKTISDALKSGSPDMAAIQAAATSVPEVTEGMVDWFPAGTGPESGVKTGASAKIWAQPDDFAAKVTAFETAAANLATAAATGDIGAISAAFGATGGTCKGCHDVYKTKG